MWSEEMEVDIAGRGHRKHKVSYVGRNLVCLRNREVVNVTYKHILEIILYLKHKT
jgi:hypothetical protein